MAKSTKHTARGKPTPLDVPEATGVADKNIQADVEAPPNETSERPRKKITLSKAALTIATELSCLRVCARDDKAELASHGIKQICELLNVLHEAVTDCVAMFASSGTVSDTVNIRGRIYPSAHHAAVREAGSFMDIFWFHVDQAGRKKAIEKFHKSPGDELLRLLGSGKGFDAKLVVTKWERAKARILELLDDKWQADFKGVAARIERERALLKEPRSPAVGDNRGKGQKGTRRIPLDKNDVAVLEAWNSGIVDIMLQADIVDAANITEKPTRTSLARLMDAGYVQRPEGRKRGYVITNAGRNAIHGSDDQSENTPAK